MKTITKTLSIGFLQLVAAVCILSCAGQTTKTETAMPESAATQTTIAPIVLPAAPPPATAIRKGAKKMLTIDTAHGKIEIELFPKDAPKTVARITELAKKGFYDGLTFHRVVPGFVVQGGDPKGDGTGGSGTNLVAEFNSQKHVEGTLAMARAQDPNSADSQFYISLGTHPHLDGNYTVFGKVTKGMDAVKQIKRGDKMVKVTAQSLSEK